MRPQGQPALSEPGQFYGPKEAAVLIRRKRANFIKARTLSIVHTKAEYINASLVPVCGTDKS